MDLKPWYLSKTLWFNAISLIVLILDTVQLNGATVLPSAWLPYIGLAVVVGNAVLRWLTGTPLAGSPPAKAAAARAAARQV